MENRLNSFGNVRGWVFGAWGETSQEAHTLVQKLGETRVRRVDILPGQSLISKSKAAHWPPKSASFGDGSPLLRFRAKQDFFLTVSSS